MSYYVAIDESGDINHSTTYFSMAAVIVRRSTDLRSVWKTFSDLKGEGKFYNTQDDKRIEVMNAIAACKVKVVSVTVNKMEPGSRYQGVIGKDLYLSVFEELMGLVADTVQSGDIDIAMDQQRFVKTLVLRESAQKCAVGCNIKKCDKKVSSDDRTIQVADFVVGAINHKYSNNDSTFYDAISERIVIARMY